jgi:hypothetical protein
VVMRAHYVTEDQLAWLLEHSPLVPNDVVLTYSRGFVRFFQGDFVSALYPPRHCCRHRSESLGLSWVALEGARHRHERDAAQAGLNEAAGREFRRLWGLRRRRPVRSTERWPGYMGRLR